MEEVKIKTAALVGVLKTNRKIHIKEYDEAVELYHRDVIQTLESELANAKEGKSYQTHFQVTQPLSFVGDYDNAITMFEMTTDEEIWLTLSQCRQYINNDWNWSNRFNDTNVMYAQKFKR